MTRNRFSRKLNRMSRRRFMSSLASLGVSAAAIPGMTQETMADLIDNPREEVPRVAAFVHTNHEEVKRGAAPKRVPIYYKIPREQWVRVESAYDARQRIEAMLESRSEAIDVWVTTNSNDEKQIKVEIYDDGSLGTYSLKAIETSIPASVDGVAGPRTEVEEVVPDIPVTVERTKVKPANSIDDEPTAEPKSVSQNDIDDLKYWHDWDEIPAGAAANFEYYLEKEGQGTLCTPVKDGTRELMLTAGHNLQYYNLTLNGAAGKPPVDDHEFEEEAHSDYGLVGTDNLDAGLLDTTSLVVDMQYAFADYGTTTGDITGTVSKSRLKDIENNGTLSYETFWRQGAKTGRDSYFGIDEVGSNAFRTTLSSSNTERGDSGGPYHIEFNLTRPIETLEIPGGQNIAEILSNGNSNIAGVHQGDDPEGSKTVATSMPDIEQKWEITI